ncbi:hypothetical protein [Prosthecobacter sp.]|uniref:hypothetical protein n=1 Tax=Prosthecobacter sp. TaxID=1965333 RepID=UPI00248A1FB0|nr:hypothetical protein [Prosthecobacter sp.]MDI1314499.1 hypothetical protein [Prosthecobacter sp.]
MKRSVLFAALLLSVLPAGAAPKNYGTITTVKGKSFYECQVVHVYPDGVTFSHRNGASKIPFAELPESLRSEFRYDAKAEADYRKQQAALRQAEQEQQKLREIAMQERLMEARMAEASYLATASRLDAASASVAEKQPPSWVGTPITGPAMGGRSYSGGSYSGFGYPFGYSGSGYYSGGYSAGIGYGYPYGGCSYGSYPVYGGYSYGGYPSYGGYYGGGYRPTVSGQWNLGNGIRIRIGGGGFGGMHHHP